ncbi:unnamed protein product [Peronospora belbahrii]|uniref:Coatomer WD associated region domain-containing protein n=1 Tax=Peronospora belbahrii TaxID=622444 RepID=A0AAU9LB85_9STRA|nr:unnamed protein product [Peronospora belbahrii]
MPLHLDIKRKLSSRSERVKSVDLHPTEPWVLSALYSGSLMIWNYATQSLVKTLEVSSLNAKFVARKQWLLRNKAFGTALDFSWSPTDIGHYIIRENILRLTLCRNFKKVKSEVPRVLSPKELRLIRKIDVVVKNVFWSENGSFIVLASEPSFFVLRYNKAVVAQSFAAGTNLPDEGIDGAFDLLHGISEKVDSTTTRAGGEVMTLAHLKQKVYLLSNARVPNCCGAS